MIPQGMIDMSKELSRCHVASAKAIAEVFISRQIIECSSNQGSPVFVYYPYVSGDGYADITSYLSDEATSLLNILAEYYDDVDLINYLYDLLLGLGYNVLYNEETLGFTVSW